jgi:hypothetical protein
VTYVARRVELAHPMRLTTIAVCGYLVLPALVEGAPRPTMAPGTASFGDIVAGPPTIDDLVFARQVLPESGPSVSEPGALALAQSRIIYLNKNGVTLTPGNNDSRTNRSTIARQQTAIPAWNVSPAVWASTVECMRELFEPFDVQIVDSDPGNVPHIEAVFGGSPTQLGLDRNVAGVSPFTTNCSIIENSIVFTFTAVLPPDPRLVCEIMAQEVAHSYGLDHELLASDPMTYLNYDGNRSFQNQAASCGETVARPCGINGSICRPNQNSFALLTERLGPKNNDRVPPTGTIVSPAPNATVPPGFTVYASASDDIMVESATLYVDGVPTETIRGSGPFEFVTSTDMAEGARRLELEVSDGVNVVQTSGITVIVQRGAPTPTPPGEDDGTGGGFADAEITGGCAAGARSPGLPGLVLALGLLGRVIRRRR